MVTQANEATAKAATATPSNGRTPRGRAPQLRTAEQILESNERVAHDLTTGAIKPKEAEQRTQCNKLPIDLAKLEMKMRDQIARFGQKSPVLRSPLIRSLQGLDPDKLEPTDGAAVRALIKEQ